MYAKFSSVDYTNLCFVSKITKLSFRLFSQYLYWCIYFLALFLILVVVHLSFNFILNTYGNAPFFWLILNICVGKPILWLFFYLWWCGNIVVYQ